MFALIENNEVRELFADDPRKSVTIKLPDGNGLLVDHQVPGWSDKLDIRQVDSRVQTGWHVQDDGSVAPDAPIKDLDAFVKSQVQIAERTPIEVNGVEFTINDLERLRNAREYLDYGDDNKPKGKTVQWRADGEFHILSAEAVNAAITAVVNHQQDAYHRYAGVIRGVADKKIKTAKQVQDELADKGE